MTKTILGYSIVTHYDDKSTETTKIPGDRLIIQTGGGGGVQSRYNYINADACPTHGAWKAVAAGVSKSTGRAYDAFWTCDTEQGEARCNNKPSRDWVETHPPHMGGASAFPAAAPAQGSSPPASAEPPNDFDDLPF